MEIEFEKNNYSRVFISYAYEDQNAAKRLYYDLKKKGLDVWIDLVDLKPGQNWKEAIKYAMKNSRYVIVLLSKNSIEKKGYIQVEIREALRIYEEYPPLSIFIIPARLDECKPLHDKFNELHWANMFPSWEDGIEKIYSAVSGNSLDTIREPESLQRDAMNLLKRSTSKLISGKISVRNPFFIWPHKSPLTISDRFSRDFQVIVTSSQIAQRLEDFFSNRNPIGFKCVTKTFWIVEQIDNIIKKNNILIQKSNCKFLRHPSWKSSIEYTEFSLLFNPQEGVILEKRNTYEFDKDYSIRSGIFNMFNVKESHYVDMNFIIMESKDESAEMLFIIFSKDGLTGFFSKESHIIDIYSNLFNSAWNFSH